nr:MAG TPA: hypothetical protein [Caudoviricetes sp.]
MATGIRTRQGKDLDEIFVRGAGDQTLGIKANTGEDIGRAVYFRITKVS